MKPAAVFLISHAALALFGFFVAFHPALVRLSALARAAAAFGAGAIALTVVAALYSLAGIPWSLAALAAPLLALTIFFMARTGRGRPAVAPPLAAVPRFSPSPAVALLAGIALFLAFLHLTLSLATSSSTSADFLFFWGVKAARFAAVRGFDVALLGWHYFGHAAPDYPPLVPVVQAWGVIAAGEMPWRRAPLAAVIWLAAALPLVLAFLRRRVSDDSALAATGFWGTAMAISLARSLSGGNAEAPLLFFEAVAGVSLLAERESEVSSRFLPALFLAGAVLTKVEGLAAAGLLVAGALLRDLLERRRGAIRGAIPLIVAPALALAGWFAFQRLSGLPAGYVGHGPLFALSYDSLGSLGKAFLRHLDAGTLWLSWIFPLLFVFASFRRLRAGVPGLLFAAGLLLFFAHDYMHDFEDPAVRIGWTLPRVSQPALSLVILAAAVVSFPGRERTADRVRSSIPAARPAGAA